MDFAIVVVRCVLWREVDAVAELGDEETALLVGGSWRFPVPMVLVEYTEF